MKTFLCLIGALALVNAKAIDLFIPGANFGYQNLLAEGEYDQENAESSISSRVLNGRPASAGQFPWQVLLYMEYSDGTSFGGGSLISPTRVLTAAHNWNNGFTSANRLRINLGTIKLNEGLVVTTTNVVIHENYYRPTVLNDIAIAIMPNAVQYTNLIQPIALPFGNNEVNNNFVGANAVASGFGDTQNGVTGSLNYVDLKVISNQQCIQEFGSLGSFIQNSNICTSGTGQVGICGGDSGGPLITYSNGKPIIIGITSFGTGSCAGNTAPSAYVRVTSYKNWIEKLL